MFRFGDFDVVIVRILATLSFIHFSKVYPSIQHVVLNTVDMKYSFFNEVSMAQQIRYSKDDLACSRGSRNLSKTPQFPRP